LEVARTGKGWGVSCGPAVEVRSKLDIWDGAGVICWYVVENPRSGGGDLLGVDGPKVGLTEDGIYAMKGGIGACGPVSTVRGAVGPVRDDEASLLDSGLIHQSESKGPRVDRRCRRSC